MTNTMNIKVAMKYRVENCFTNDWNEWKDCTNVQDIFEMSKDSRADFQIALFYYDVETNEEIGWNSGIVIHDGRKIKGNDFPKCMGIF